MKKGSMNYRSPFHSTSIKRFLLWPHGGCGVRFVNVYKNQHLCNLLPELSSTFPVFGYIRNGTKKSRCFRGWCSCYSRARYYASYHNAR